MSATTAHEGGEPRVTTLASGLRVVTENMPHVETINMGVWFGAGARDEAQDEHGVAHLLEHMAFKGTRRRSARQIAEEIEAVGGEINAMTTFENTSYTARLLADDMPLGLDILSDILLEPAFDPQELERERGVIVQEIGAYDDSPEDLVHDWLTEVAFAGQPLGRSILGTPDSVRGHDAPKVRGFMERAYRPAEAIVAAAGRVDHDALVAEVERRFAGFAGDPPDASASAAYVGGERRASRRLEQAHLAFGFRGRALRDPGAFATLAFANAVGGGMSSRLFQEIREKRGLAYSIHAFHWAFEDAGLFGVYGGTSREHAGELARVAFDTLADATRTLSEEELARARAQMKMSLLGALEAPQARADQIARHMLLWGRVLTRDEIVAKIEGVTIADARAAGEALFAAPPTLVAVGPVRGTPRLDALARRVGAPSA